MDFKPERASGGKWILGLIAVPFTLITPFAVW
jgi:hypothetical protein